MSLPNLKDIVMYKTRNKYGDVIKREVRKVIRLLKNTQGRPIIEWESPKNMGVCIPSTWDDWCNDIDENKRRGNVRYRSV